MTEDRGEGVAVPWTGCTEGHGCGWLKLRVEKWKKKVSANELEILERII